MIRFSGAQLRPLIRVSLSVVAVTWGACFIGWSVVHGRFWDNMAFATCMGAVVSLGIVFSVSFVVRWSGGRGANRRDAL